MSGREWITGRNPVYEVLRAGRRSAYRLLLAEGVKVNGRIQTILDQAAVRRLPVSHVPRDRLDSLVGCEHQGLALETSPYPYVEARELLEGLGALAEPALILLLDSLQDPQNLGTLLRTGEIVGVHGVILPLRRAAGVTPAVVQASSGATEYLRIARANLAQAMQSLSEAGIWVIGLEASGAEAVGPDQVRFDLPLALVVGSEGSGLRRLISERCDFLLQLPSRGRIDSLNAAVAGSIALYLAWQARGYPGG